MMKKCCSSKERNQSAWLCGIKLFSTCVNKILGAHCPDWAVSINKKIFINSQKRKIITFLSFGCFLLLNYFWCKINVATAVKHMKIQLEVQKFSSSMQRAGMKSLPDWNLALGPYVWHPCCRAFLWPSLYFLNILFLAVVSGSTDILANWLHYFYIGWALVEFKLFLVKLVFL